MAWSLQKYQYVSSTNKCLQVPTSTKYQQVPKNVSGVALSSCCTLRKLEAGGAAGLPMHCFGMGGSDFCCCLGKFRDFTIPRTWAEVAWCLVYPCIASGSPTYPCIACLGLGGVGGGRRWYQFALPFRQIKIAQIFIHRDFPSDGTSENMVLKWFSLARKLLPNLTLLLTRVPT